MARIASYAHIHDKLLRQYRRASLYLAWGAAFGVLALVFYTSYYLRGEETFGIGGGYNIATNLALLILGLTGVDGAIYILILFALQLGLGAFFAVCSVKAHSGHLGFLIAGTAAYGIDALVLAFSPLQNAFKPLDYLLSLIAHIVVLFFCGLSFYKRHALYALAAAQRRELLLPERDPEAVTTVLSYRKPKRDLDRKQVFGAADEPETSETPPSDRA